MIYSINLGLILPPEFFWYHIDKLMLDKITPYSFNCNKMMNIGFIMKCYYELYKSDYTSRKRNKRLPYLYQSICLLTHEINSNISLINDSEPNPILIKYSGNLCNLDMTPI